jgi:cyclic pyranopterin phosphate synthase
MTTLTQEGAAAHAISTEQLRDGHGRVISDLRVSVTDLCNLRCQYCMPAEGVEWMPREAILSFEEIERLVSILTAMGVDSVRLTGGEPLVRRDLPQLASMLGRLDGLDDLSITTNGYFLRRDAEALVRAGVSRFNVSLDALTRERFAEITRRDAFERTLDGLRALEEIDGIRAIKVNAVAIRGFTEPDIVGFAELARTRPFEVRFIECMPLGDPGTWQRENVLTGAEVRSMVDAVHPLVQREREDHATANLWDFADGSGAIGFINPVSEPFCSDCNRIRLTADGRLRTCLFSHRETDLRALLRGGADDLEIAETIRAAVWKKELKHDIGEVGFVQPERTMSQIGG